MYWQLQEPEPEPEPQPEPQPAAPEVPLIGIDDDGGCSKTRTHCSHLAFQQNSVKLKPQLAQHAGGDEQHHAYLSYMLQCDLEALLPSWHKDGVYAHTDGSAPLVNGYPKPSNPLDELLSGMAIVPAGPTVAQQPQQSPPAASAAVSAVILGGMCCYFCSSSGNVLVGMRGALSLTLSDL